MKKVSVLALTAVLVLSAAAIAAPAARSTQDNPSSSSMKSMRGTISSVDNGAKSFVVKDANGKEATVFWNDATRLSGELATGATVVVQTSMQDGKTVATSIQVSGAKKPY
jgi:hypothetical protein